MSTQNEKQLAEFVSLLSEARRIIDSENSTGNDTITWGTLRQDPVVKAFFEERLVAVVIAAKMNKLVQILVPNESQTATTSNKKLVTAKKPVLPRELRLATDGSTDQFEIKLLTETPTQIEEALAKTSSAKAAALHKERMQAKTTKDTDRVTRHQERLRQQANTVANMSGITSDPLSSNNREEIEITEEIEEVEEVEEIQDESEPGDDDDPAPPPPPPDEDEPPPPPPDEEAPPPPPDDNDEAPPPPPDDDDMPPPPPPDYDEPPPPPPDE